MPTKALRSIRERPPRGATTSMRGRCRPFAASLAAIGSSTASAGWTAAGSGSGIGSGPFGLRAVIGTAASRGSSGGFGRKDGAGAGGRNGVASGREFGVNTGRKRRCGWFDA
ncbi:hypothetical protein FV230_05190, partial [Methylobacterium sp. WL6]